MTGQADVVVVAAGTTAWSRRPTCVGRAEDVVCERRGVSGGAAVSEHPFGPDYTVTSLSYVVSLLPPDLVRDLRLNQHGTHVPQGPYPRRARTDAACACPRTRLNYTEIAEFSRPTPTPTPYEEYLAGPKDPRAAAAPDPPRLGSRRPQDLLREARLLTTLRAVDEIAAVDVNRLLTGSTADLLEGYFESEALLGLLSVSGVIGTWAGPRRRGPRT